MVRPHPLRPSTQAATSTSWLRRACFPPVVSITAESFGELHPGDCLLAPAVYTAADNALSWELWLLCHLSGPRALPWEYASPFLPKLSTPFPSPAPSPPQHTPKHAAPMVLSAFCLKYKIRNEREV